MTQSKTIPIAHDVQVSDWQNDSCDKYDYLIAAFCGAAAGILDVLFVDSPVDSKLLKWSDAATDQIVMRFASMAGWEPTSEKAHNIASAIGFLERNYPVNYDQRHSTDVGGTFTLSTRNHHMKSLAHAPDPIGLFFSILDQFTGQSSFLDRGQLICIDTSTRDFRLQGSNLPSMLFCGACNWFGHLMSDIAGSSGSRGHQKTGRGTGLPMPFYELFSLCNFGSFQVEKDRQTLAEIMVRAFQEGYDARSGVTQTMPVLLQEALISVIWSVKRHYYADKPWDECIPGNTHPDLRIMKIVGYGTFCLIDGADAAIRSGGNALLFVLRMNMVAWSRLILLVFRELSIRYGNVVENQAKHFLSIIGFADTYGLQQYYWRMNTLNKSIEEQLVHLQEQVNKDYRIYITSVHFILEDNMLNTIDRVQKSVDIARQHGVPENRILHNVEELDAWVMG